MCSIKQFKDECDEPVEVMLFCIALTGATEYPHFNMRRITMLLALASCGSSNKEKLLRKKQTCEFKKAA